MFISVLIFLSMHKGAYVFAVIYRGFVLPQNEKRYRKAWHKIATYFVEKCGALGSALHQTQEGEWIAYSRWPNQQTRDKFWVDQETLPDEIKLSIQNLKECVDPIRPSEEISMTVIEDLLIP